MSNAEHLKLKISTDSVALLEKLMTVEWNVETAETETTGKTKGGESSKKEAKGGDSGAATAVKQKKGVRSPLEETQVHSLVCEKTRS